jgi:hypothetical protein
MDDPMGELSTDRPARWRRSAVPIALCGAVVALAFATHYEVLTYWFTGPDTLTLIETSRITDTKTAIDTLTAPLMHGTNFVALTGEFYRPVSSLSYAIDYWVWGLDPFGYHLTDLLAHATAAALVCWLAYDVLDGSTETGVKTGTGAGTGAEAERERRSVWSRSPRTIGGTRLTGALTGALAGGLFALHPLTAEVVPVPARRHDVLATVFVLASLVALTRGLRASRPGPRLRYLGLSLVAYALALGSKEVSVVLPALAVTWTALDVYSRSEGGGGLWRTIRTTFVVGLGYAVVSLSYLGLRVSLLGGIGGYVGPFGGVKNATAALVTSQYFLSLFYPVDLLEFGDAVAYVPATVYVVAAVWTTLAVLAIVGAGGLGPLVRSAAGRLAVLFSVWLLAPIPLLVRVGEYSPWTGYIALVPVAGLSALLVTSAAGSAYRWTSRLVGDAGVAGSDGHASGDSPVRSDRTNERIEDGGSRDRGANGRPNGIEMLRAGVGIGGSVVVLASAAVLVLSLVWVSPLAYAYDGWDHASSVTEDALTDAEREANGLPPEAVLKVEGLPNVVTLGPPTAEPRVKSLRYFWAHSVRSWVRLREPNSRLSTFTHGITTPVGNGPTEVRVEAEPRPNAPTVMRFRYESRPSSRQSGTVGRAAANASSAASPGDRDRAEARVRIRTEIGDDGQPKRA